jgi:hypothetical protein
MARPALFTFPNPPPVLGDPDFASEAQGFLGSFPSLVAYVEDMADWFETDFAKVLGLGTAALPSLAFDGDSNTGIYSPAPNQLAISTGGIRRLLVSDTAFQIDVPATGSGVQSALDDATPGRLLKVGAFGLGLGVAEPLPIAALNSALKVGSYTYQSSDPNSPTASSGTVVVTKTFTTNIRQDALILGSQLRFSRHSLNSGTTWTAWAPVYTAGNILGTVSQLAGVPTGAILEEGDNANGNYIRFADGTQICWFNLTTTIAITTAYLGGFRSGGIIWTLPVAFSTTPASMVTPINFSAYGAVGTNTGNVGSFQFSALSVASDGSKSRAFSLVATGRWF